LLDLEKRARKSSFSISVEARSEMDSYMADGSTPSDAMSDHNMSFSSLAGEPFGSACKKSRSEVHLADLALP
jgi:hypothetical protein